jgi:hypothetical protein
MEYNALCTNFVYFYLLNVCKLELLLRYDITTDVSLKENISLKVYKAAVSISKYVSTEAAKSF